MVNIEIYIKVICLFCICVKVLLNSKGVMFYELLIDGDVVKCEEMIQCSGWMMVLQIFIDVQYIGGCDDLYVFDLCGGFDFFLC